MDTLQLRNVLDLVGERAEQEELLDLGQGSSRDVAANLAEMQRINDVLGGTRALTRYLYPRLLLHNEPVTVLDLGTGGGGLPRTLVSWARLLKLPLRVLAVDWSPRNLAVAAQQAERWPEISLIQADAVCLPLESGQVDYVISSLFMHHFSPQRLVNLMREAYRLARVEVIMSDLVRGWLPYLAYQLVQPVFARNYLTRHDGALSIRRAYTAGEIDRLAVRAGLLDHSIYTHFPWRMTLVMQK